MSRKPTVRSTQLKRAGERLADVWKTARIQFGCTYESLSEFPGCCSRSSSTARRGTMTLATELRF